LRYFFDLIFSYCGLEVQPLYCVEPPRTDPRSNLINFSDNQGGSGRRIKNILEDLGWDAE